MFERKTIVLLLCCGLLSACAIFDGARNTSSPVPFETPRPRLSDQESEVLSWLAAYRMLANASLDEQRKVYQGAQAALAKNNSDSNRLRLALALSLPGVPWRDDNKLMSTLEATPSLFKLSDDPLHQLVFVLYKQAQERQRLRDEQRKRETDLLDEQKQRLHDEQRRHEAELLGEQRQNEELQMKLDALRRIDQDIKQRKHGLENTP